MTATETWVHRWYGSGTQIVANDANLLAPCLYVYGPRFDNEDDSDRARYQVCEELAAFLNGGPRPAWLDDMERVSESSLSDLDGSLIDAVGPLYDIDPPKLNWQQRDDEDSRSARARLIDRLSFGRRSAQQ